MKKYLTTETLLGVIAFALAIYMITFPFVTTPYIIADGPSWAGLDVSWQMTLNYALMKKWVWGDDIIYTYGPLGFLATRIGWGISRWVFLLFDLFMVFNFFFIFRDFLRAATDKWIGSLILLTITIIVNPNHGSDLSWVVTVFSFYWMYKLQEHPHYKYFVILCVNILICFYLKMNAGLIGMVLLGGLLVNMLIFKRIRILTAVIVVASLAVAVVGTSFLLHVSLINYLKNAFHIISGYNDAMTMLAYGYLPLEINVNVLFYCFIGLYIIYVVALIKDRKFEYLFFAGIALLYTFLLRKQAVVRNDAFHYYEFYSYAPLILLSGFFIAPLKNMKKPMMAFVMLICIMCLGYNGSKAWDSINNAAEIRYGGLAGYINSFSNYNKRTYADKQRMRHIPPRVLNQIKNSSVDIFPWDSEYLLENKLNYTPRPIFQSFSAYTAKLQKLNYDFYLKSPPEYVIYDFESIDDRYAFNDDILVNFFICKNYSFADSFTSNSRWRAVLKLKDKPQPLNVEIQQKPKTLYAIGKDIPTDESMMMRMRINFTNAGKIESTMYRTPMVKVRMMRANGQWVAYKVSKKILESGIFVHRWINNNHDYVKYMYDANMLDRFVKVQIVADNKYYSDKIEVEYYNIK